MTMDNKHVVLPDYGQRVAVTEKYRRRQRKHDRGTWKYWDKEPFAADDCIFLGTRVLQNGIRYYDYEEGYSFDTHERFIAALISPGADRNPIYAPIESIEPHEV